MATRKKNAKESLTGFHPSISFYDRQIFHRCRRKGLVDGCLNILSLKNGKVVLETLFGAMVFPVLEKLFSSMVVNHLGTQFKGKNTGVACIYLNHKEVDNHTPSRLLAGLWRQLVLDRDIGSIAETLYQQHQEKGTAPSLEEVDNVLSSSFKMFSQVFIIVDAMDEYPESQREILLQQLTAMASNVNLMITSRPNISLEPSSFRNLERLDIHAMEDDLRKYVDAQIVSSPRLRMHVMKEPGLQEEIHSKINTQTVDGMFLLAKLHIQSLSTKNTIKALREAMKELPKGLDDSYDTTMQRIDDQTEEDKKTARSALIWVAHAKRPLNVSEITGALAIEPGDRKLDEDNVLDINIILSVCAGLVIVDKQSSVVRLIHYTTQEYLDKIQAEKFPDAQTEMTRTLLTVLAFDGYPNHSWSQRRATPPPLVDYSQYCLAHAAGHPEEQLRENLLMFLDQAPQWNKTLMWVWHSPPWNYADWPSQPSALWIAAAANLGETTKFLLEQPLLRGYQGTEIIVASYYGHFHIVQLLVENEAHGNAQSEQYVSAFYVALVKQHKEIAKLLLSNLISRHRDAFNLTTDELPTLINVGNPVQTFSSLDSLALALLRRFEQTGQLRDLEESIAFHRQTLELRPESHPDRSSSLSNLATALEIRFEQTGQMADLEESITFHQQALELRPGSHPDRSNSLSKLATALRTQFQQIGQLANLEESIAFHRQALELRPGAHPDRSNSLSNLATALQTRFEQTGQLADLEESIAFHRQALELFPGSHPDRSSSLSNLALALCTRFEQTGQLADLEESITFHQQALELRPGSHPHRSDSLNNLSTALHTRFEQTGQLADLEESIAFHRQALELFPGSHPHRPGSLNNLALALWTRFEQTGQMADLEESITFHRQALELRPGSHPDRSSSLNNLANALLTRFQQTGQLADLEESIPFHRQALKLFRGSHPNRSSSLSNLALALWTQFEQTGQLADLEESITFHQQALELRPGSHPHRSDSLNNLALALLTRFQQTGQLADLEESIAFHRQALELFRGSHPNRSTSLSNLATALQTRFEQTGQQADLEESITFHQQALELRTGSHPNRSGSLSNLANALSTRFEQTGQLADLEESIAFHRQALELFPGSHPNRSGSLSNLANALSTRFEQTGQLADLEESIAFHQQALELFPGSHPNRSSSLINLATALQTRFEQTGQQADLEESMTFHQQASELRTGSHPN
ncbi:hypothetical protein C8F04DRAFT_237798 [Mycena alexandri]|uniref:TPR-like protein n=1 Tax=Mycena alexandri TaxID=1745969 RepID=A0AAD6X8F1_9AGAR|nr:hypothetical protein C8F04DRAFT_237798 [Mycena alexandri]